MSYIERRATSDEFFSLGYSARERNDAQGPHRESGLVVIDRHVAGVLQVLGGRGAIRLQRSDALKILES
jgi:hypothetical protein